MRGRRSGELRRNEQRMTEMELSREPPCSGHGGTGCRAACSAYAVSRPGATHAPSTGSAQRRVCRKAGPPGKAWGLRKPWKGILPASCSRGAEYSVFCITCPASCKRGSSPCVIHLLAVEYQPASPETDSESLFTLHGTAAGSRFAKAAKTRKAPSLEGAFYMG